MLTVDLANYFDNIGATAAHRTAAGRFNVWGNSFAAEDLPGPRSVVRVGAVPFAMPPFGGEAPDNVRCAGQYVDLPRTDRSTDWIQLLAAGERRVEDELALHFGDGTLDFEPVRVSDFWAAPGVFGEVEAFRAVMHYPVHTQHGVHATVWAQRVPVTRRAALIGIGLPDNAALHIFALTLQPAAPVDPVAAR